MLITTVSAQKFVIDGRVFHELGDDLGDIHIYNSTSSQGTLTNQEGKFKLTVSVGDTIVVSAVQFQKIKEIITQEHYKTKTIIFELSVNRNELDEILLQKSDNQEINALSLGIIKREIKPLTQSERKLYTATEGWVFGPVVPLHAVINAISGRTKKLKHRVKVDRDNQIIEELLVRFPPTYFMEFDINEENIYEFLFYCESDPSFSEIVSSPPLYLLDFFIEKAEKFNQIKKQR